MLKLLPKLKQEGQKLRRMKVLDFYVKDAPSNQAAVDIFKGEWSSRFPGDAALQAGTVSLYDDDRIHWCLERLGDIAGKKFLELGPLEAGHTYMLEQAGAEVTAVEANQRAFLKCLISKEIFGLKATFKLGEMNAYLKENKAHYDMCLASGVLYHQTDPAATLELLAKTCDTLLIWTHYYDDAILSNHISAKQFKRGAKKKVNFRGMEITYHPRHYMSSLNFGGFCGGCENTANWMERSDILEVLSILGFTQQEIGFDDTNHPHGPSFLVLARK